MTARRHAVRTQLRERGVVDLVGCRGELPENLDAPVITVCNVGNASISGMLVLKSLGYRNVKSMNGGTAGWMDRGLPTE